MKAHSISERHHIRIPSTLLANRSPVFDQGNQGGRVSDPNVTTEEHRVAGESLLDKVKDLIRQGNVRRIIIKNDHGQTLLEIPLTIGVVGAALAPVWAAIAAVAALAASLTIVVEKVDTSPPESLEDVDIEKGEEPA